MMATEMPGLIFARVAVVFVERPALITVDVRFRRLVFFCKKAGQSGKRGGDPLQRQDRQECK